MPTIPAPLLKQLYSRGSLRNTAAGWEFQMRNPLATAQLIGIGLTCDGAAVPATAIGVQQADLPAPRPATAITADAPLAFAVGVTTVVQVSGAHLTSGPHALSIRADTREIGSVTIAVRDTVAE
ncbi:MAG: hypothetical protein M3Z04_06240 [Chloroflexota bacterium]|nr:hypothetical protein [Chloroflexota bacterium]